MGTGIVPMETLSKSDVFLAVMGGTIAGGLVLWVFGWMTELLQYDSDDDN